jgi:hypothetical protein
VLHSVSKGLAMTDVVLKLPIQPGEEAHLFGQYLAEFMARSLRWAEPRAATANAPFLMIRGDPASGQEAKVLIFQEDRLARAFSNGWDRRRGAGSAMV